MLFNAVDRPGYFWLLACSALLFLVAVLDCCWLDREGVAFMSQNTLRVGVSVGVSSFLIEFREHTDGNRTRGTRF